MRIALKIDAEPGNILRITIEIDAAHRAIF